MRMMASAYLQLRNRNSSKKATAQVEALAMAYT
jgi:hypothetical protein